MDLNLQKLLRLYKTDLLKIYVKKYADMSTEEDAKDIQLKQLLKTKELER